MGLSRPKVSADDGTIARLRHELAETRAALEQSAAERHRLEQMAMTAVERERRLLAQTLHDTLSQSLTVIYLQAQVIAKNLQRNSAHGVQEVTALAETIHNTVIELSNVTRSLQSLQSAGELASGPNERM